MSALDSELHNPRESKPDESEGICPRCQEPMNEYFFGVMDKYFPPIGVVPNDLRQIDDMMCNDCQTKMDGQWNKVLRTLTLEQWKAVANAILDSHQMATIK